MKKLLYNLRTKLLLHGLDLYKGIEFWFFSSLKEDDKKIEHRKECDKMLLSLQSNERIVIMKWMQKKIEYLVKENAKDKTEFMQARLFQALLEHNQIKAIHEADQMREDLGQK